MSFDVGDRLRLRVTITVSGAPTDPTDVILKIKPSGGGVTTYSYLTATVTKESVGVYSTLVDITVGGTHYYRWETTGTAKGAKEESFVVNPTQFT